MQLLLASALPTVLGIAAGGAWTPAADMAAKRMEASMASVGDGRVAYVGGAQMGGSVSSMRNAQWRSSPPANSAPLKSAAMFDAASNVWSALPDMSSPRDSPGSCVISSNGKKTLYVFGGTTAYPTPPHTQMNVTISAEMLVLDGSSSWQSAPPLPSARTSPSVTSLKDGSGCIIACGFVDDPATGSFGYLQDSYLFDGASYKQLPDVPFKRSNMGIAATSDGVYVIGGGETDPSYYNVSYLQMSPMADTWKPIAPLNYARSWTMVAALTDPVSGEEKIVAAGGMSLIPMFDPMASVEIYSTKLNSWKLMDDGSRGSLPTPIGFGSGAPINATHMIAAGGVGAGTTGTETLIYALPTASTA
jgi:hypothetical protein